MGFKLRLPRNTSPFMGAAFLMATSAIGPGFITQTTVFTGRLGASFGFVILVSILLDLVVQWNIWRAVAASGLKAPVLANKVLPGAGHLLAVLVVMGGMVFNIGNIAGCGLGIESMTGLPASYGALLSGLAAILIFMVKEFGKAMDTAAKWLGFLMIAMVLVVAWYAQPPLAEMAKRSLWPSHIDITAILTLVGGTVGGYISFAGAHRMLDALKGEPAHMKQVSRSASAGIIVSGIMRILLFAAAFGVINTGFVPSADNPAGSIFKYALGGVGEKVFGAILWCAAITSVVGASYTSVSFLENFHPVILKRRPVFIGIFIGLATALFWWFGQPVKILVAAGAVNGLILPVSLGLILLALHKYIRGLGYKHPAWLTMAGWVVVAIMTAMSIGAISSLFP